MTLFFLIFAPIVFGAGLALPLYLYTQQRERAEWRRYISRREPSAAWARAYDLQNSLGRKEPTL
jgi:hypothetical protein